MIRTLRLSPLTRRAFLRRLATITAAGAGASRWLNSASSQAAVQTVLGPVAAARLGLTLPHEHIMCDFIGADQTGRHRWQVNSVVEKMRPFLVNLKERGAGCFVDCTPAYIGRDPRVLKRLAQETGLHIVTNTGYYGGAGDRFVPKHAYEETADQLAERWFKEWKDGIEDTEIKPGFIKIGIDEIPSGATKLSPIDEKLVRAAARASRRSGLAVTCHTGGGAAGLAATKLFIEEKADVSRFIVAHSDGHGISLNQTVAELGAWVSLDGISRRPIEEHLDLVQRLSPAHADRLLLSQDNGWYWVEQSNGGEVRDFNYLIDVFLPACRKRGITEELIRQWTVDNPARALAC